MGGTFPGILEAAIALCDLNGWGVLCLGMCYCCFALHLCAPNGVSNKHSRWDRFFYNKDVLWRGGGYTITGFFVPPLGV